MLMFTVKVIELIAVLLGFVYGIDLFNEFSRQITDKTIQKKSKILTILMANVLIGVGLFAMVQYLYQVISTWNRFGIGQILLLIWMIYVVIMNCKYKHPEEMNKVDEIILKVIVCLTLLAYIGGGVFVPIFKLL